MSEPAWLSYTGAITGVVGAITGIAGAIMGYIGYRRTKELKALDLRLELRKGENELRGLVQDLPAHLEHAQKSRKAVASAIGHLGSGALKKWLADWEADFESANSMVAALPPTSAEYGALDHATLEGKLVAVHAALGNARQLREKYDAMLAADDRERDHIREDVRARTEAKLEGKS